MLDLHTHILPGMDDGSRSVKQSIRMLEIEAEQGVDTVVMTPHYDAGKESPMAFALRKAKAERKLLEALGDRSGIPDLLSGAEVAFFEGISRVETLKPLCIGGARFILIEMPFCTWNKRMLGELDVLRQVRGVQPILAHIERYRSLQPAGLFDELSEKGFWQQCNTSYFLHWQTSRQAMSMLKHRVVHFIASDCHGPEYRPPNLGETMAKIEKKMGGQVMTFLRENEKALLGG